MNASTRSVLALLMAAAAPALDASRGLESARRAAREGGTEGGRPRDDTTPPRGDVPTRRPVVPARLLLVLDAGRLDLGWRQGRRGEDDGRRPAPGLAAAQKVKAPFSLATCGWVLGPPQDQTLFDRELPKDVALSCINRTVGHSPVERGVAAVQGRPAWAIPWLEDDPSSTKPISGQPSVTADVARDGVAAFRHAQPIAGEPAALVTVRAPAIAAAAAWRQDWPPGARAVEGPIGGYPFREARPPVAAAGHLDRRTGGPRSRRPALGRGQGGLRLRGRARGPAAARARRGEPRAA